MQETTNLLFFHRQQEDWLCLLEFSRMKFLWKKPKKSGLV